MFKFLEKNWNEFPVNRKKEKFFSVSPPLDNMSLDGVLNIYDLHRYINNFDELDFIKEAQNTVIYDGNIKSKIMIVGEAPGAKEDEDGIPFVGKSGQLIRNLLKENGLDPMDCYITNCVFWRPPGNRKPTEKELNLCRPMFLKQLNLIRPTHILLLGSTSLQMFFDYKYTITRARGQILDYNGIKTIPTFHPSYILRFPKFNPLMEKDIKTFVSLVKS